MKKLAILLSVLLCVVFFTCYVAAEEATGEVTEETVVSVSRALELDAGTPVLVEGLYVGLSCTTSLGENFEVLVKDIASDDIISVRNVPCVTFPDDIIYKKGDKILFLATVSAYPDDDTSNPGKKFLDFSADNEELADTVVSPGNEVTFTLSDPIVISSWADMKNNFKLGIEPYTLFKITGTTYMNISSANSYRPHKVSSAESYKDFYTEGSRTIALQDEAMIKNLGSTWYKILFPSKPTQGAVPGTKFEKDFYVLYVGADSYRFYCVILDESWVSDPPPATANYTTEEKVIYEVAYAYARQGTQIQYDQYNQRRHVSPSPEDATSQRRIFLDCSSYVNSVYREAFGINILPDDVPSELYTYPIGCSTSKMDKYAEAYQGKRPDVVGYWDTTLYTTDEEKAAVKAFFEENLKIGDVLNYRHGKLSGSSGHVYIYVGNGIFLHRPGSGSYTVVEDNPAASYDNAASEGSIEPMDLDALFDPASGKRYLFNKTTDDTVWSFSLIRPLARGEFEPTAESMGRITVPGLVMEKTSNINENSSVVAGGTITYTVTLKNDTVYPIYDVTLTDVLPTGTTYVEGSEGVTVKDGTLTWTGDVAKSATVTVTYIVEVPASTEEGTLIVSDKTDVNGVGLGKITHTVSTYSSENSAALTAKITDYTTNEIGFGSNVEMARALYNETLNINLFDTYASVGEMLDDLIDDDSEKKNYTRRTDTKLSEMIAPNLFGGMNIRYGHYTIPDNDRARLISKEELAVGDIILADWSGGDVLYVYAGGTTLLTLESGKATALTIGTDIYGTDADNILVSLYAYDRVAVLRPSMTTTVDATKEEQATLSITCDTTLSCGEAITLATSGGSGDGDVIYTVTNGDGSATVSGNLLIGQKAGTVTVTAIKAADDTYNSVVSAPITVTVKAPEPISITVSGGKIISGLDFNKYIYKISPITFKRSVTPAIHPDNWADFLPVADGNATAYVENTNASSSITANAKTYANGLNDTSTIAISYRPTEIYYTAIVNESLAGVYKLRRFSATTGAEVGDPITFYADGTVDQKQSLSKGAGNSDNRTEITWRIGRFSTVGHNTNSSGTSYIATHTDNNHYGVVPDSSILFANNSGNTSSKYSLPTSYDSVAGTIGLENGNSIPLDEYLDAVEKYSAKYALRNYEIIPTTDFASLTYGVYTYTGTVFSGHKTRLEIVVYNSQSGVLETYAAIPDSLTTGEGSDAISKHTATASMAKFVNSDGTLDDTKTLATIGEGYYIIGYEIFAADALTAENISSFSDTGLKLGFAIYYGEYDIDTQVLDVPKFTFDPATKVVSGLEANNKDAYYILQLELDKTGTEMQVVENSKQNLATNAKGKADLSALTGLWGIGANSNDHGTESTYKMIYLSGPSGEKRYIGDGSTFATDGKPAVSSGATWTGNNYWTDWEKGVWKGSDYIDPTSSFIKYGDYYRVSSNAASVPSLAGANTYKPLLSGTAEEKLAAQETIAAQINNFSYKYAYMDDEIIPAKDFTNFTYRVGKRQGSASLGASESSANTNTKLVVYVAEPDNTITTYEYTANEPSMYIKGTKFSTQNISKNKPIVFTADVLLNSDEKPLKDSKGYIVGIEIFPVQITDHKEITTTGTTKFCFAVDIRYTDDEYKIATHTFKAPTATLREGDTLVVADYNEDYKYEYKESTAESWTDLPGESVSVDKAGTDYDVRVAATDYYGASAASSAGKSHTFVATGTSLLLSGDIGIKTTFDVSDTAAFGALKFFDTATGDEVKVVKDANSVTIYVPAKDKAKNFEYRYTYNDKTVTRSFETIASYIEKFSSEDVTENALISALDNYTDYSAVYFGVNGATADGTVSNDLASASEPEASFTNSIEGFEYIGAALVLEGKTAIRHYFRADSSATTYTVTINGETVTDAVVFDLDNNCYYVDVPDISAVSYDVPNTVEIGFADKKSIIKYSVMNYLVKNVNKTDKPDLVNLVKAMYDYHVAAKAYDALQANN